MLRYTTALVLLLGCGPGLATFTPATRSTSAEGDALYKSALRVASDNALTVATKDAEAGLIVTEWEPSKFVSTPLRLRWRFTLDTGEVTVTSQCQQEKTNTLTDAKSWEDCESQPAGRTEKAAAMADAIVAGAE